MRVLVIGSDFPCNPTMLLRPHGLFEFRAELEQKLRSSFEFCFDLPLEQFQSCIETSRPDVVLLLVCWAYPIEAVAALLEDLAKIPARPHLVLLDQSDQSSSPFLSLLPKVDLMIKSQVLRDLSAYTKPMRSGYIFTEFLERELDYDLQAWHFGTTAEVSELPKLQLGWNLGATRRVRRLLRLGDAWSIPWRVRPYAINCRLGVAVANGEWYADYRNFAYKSLKAATHGLLTTGKERVSPRRYLLEIAMSRLVFSPFGWGEVCYRDYEAVALGALLIKPAMEHLETNPNIFVPRETYLPVRWDLADLEEVCHRALSEPDKSRQIVANARQVLKDYFRKGQFVESVGSLLNQATTR